MRIRRGACYLLESETADTAYRLFVRLLAEMGSGFCISRIHPDKVRTRFGLGEVRIGWLAEVPGEDHFSANALASVARAVQQFIQEHGSSGLVLIDGLEYVILHNGVQPTRLASVDHLNEFAMGTPADVPATRGACVPGAPARLRRPDRRRVFPLDPWRRLHAEHELAQRLPIMVGPDPAGRIVRAAPGWNRPERPPFLRPPRPVELPHVGIALGTRPQPVRRPRASPRRAGLRLPRHPDVALLLAGLFRIARRLDLDCNTRRAPRHLHRGRALLGPRTEARGPRGPSTDLETVKLRKENITSRADRLLKDGRTDRKSTRLNSSHT